MRAAVFSDTHGCTSLMLGAIRRSRPDIIIHLGDFVRDTADIQREFPEIPLYSVCGNCDIAALAPLSDTVPMGPVTAFICHGHEFNVNWSVNSLVYAAQEAGAKLALYGHTHQAACEEIGGVVTVNPGTAGRGRTLSWALIEVRDNGGIAVDIREL